MMPFFSTMCSCVKIFLHGDPKDTHEKALNFGKYLRILNVCLNLIHLIKTETLTVAVTLQFCHFLYFYCMIIVRMVISPLVERPSALRAVCFLCSRKCSEFEVRIAID